MDTDHNLNQAEVDHARREIRNRFGAEMASKASDAFCVGFGGGTSRLSFRGGEGAAADTPPPRPVIVEFSSEQGKLKEVSNAAQNVRKHQEWRRFEDSLLKVQEPVLRLQAAQLLRQSKTEAVREDFFKAAGPVWDEIERNALNLSAPTTGGETPAAVPSAMTEVCWLNRSIRTLVDPRSLVEVVADPGVQHIDLPRRLNAEARTTAHTVGAPPYRERTGRTGKGVIVAVIDSEISLRHPALRNRVIQKQNLSPESWGNPGKHGTAVAGIIAANGGGFVGIAPEVTIYNYKVLATNRYQSADDFGGALAIQQALEDGAHIANCSWGVTIAGSEKSREAVACDTAWELGLTIVKSAGNDGADASTITTPGEADGIIVVGATDQAGSAVQDYSSRGPIPGGEFRPHLVAPGGTVDDGLESCLVGGGFGNVGYGTSYAAPHVSGLLALILEGEPNLTPHEQRTRFLSWCTSLGAGDANAQGQGLISLNGLS